MAEVIAPTNRDGDTIGSQWQPDDGHIVVTPDSFKPAYAKWVESGFGAMPFDPDYGGAGFPWISAIAVQEMLTSRQHGAVAVPAADPGRDRRHPRPRLRRAEGDLPPEDDDRRVDRHDEPDRAAGRLRRRRRHDQGRTRRPTRRSGGAPAPTASPARRSSSPGASTTSPRTSSTSCSPAPRVASRHEGHLDVPRAEVPARTPTARSASATRPTCVSIEHKLGIHGSPTCVMAYEGAIGWLVGGEHEGMRNMFTMMNNARLSVGLEGLCISERAYQQALQYAQDATQGRADRRAEPGTSSPIIDHPDVRRMLMTQRAWIDAMRCARLHERRRARPRRRRPRRRRRRRGATAGRSSPTC